MARTRNYINNKDLTAAVVDYQKSCKKAEKIGLIAPPMPKYIGESIMQICNRLTKGWGFDFSAYTYRDEMIADAIERCCYAIRKFNAKKSTSGAFSYLTTVAINAQKKRITDEKRQNYTKHKYFQAQYTTHDIDNIHKEAGTIDSPNEMSYKVIEDFEGSLARKQEKILTKQRQSNRIKSKRRKK